MESAVTEPDITDYNKKMDIDIMKIAITEIQSQKMEIVIMEIAITELINSVIVIKF